MACCSWIYSKLIRQGFRWWYHFHPKAWWITRKSTHRCTSLICVLLVLLVLFVILALLVLLVLLVLLKYYWYYFEGIWDRSDIVSWKLVIKWEMEIHHLSHKSIGEPVNQVKIEKYWKIKCHIYFSYVLTYFDSSRAKSNLD